MPTLREMYASAGELLKQARDLQDEYEKKKEAPPADIAAKIDELLDKAEAASAAAQAEEKAGARAGRFTELDRVLHLPDPANALPTPGDGESKAGGPVVIGGRVIDRPATPAQLKAFARALIAGPNALDAAERKDLQTTIDASGGYLVAPQQWVATLLKFVDDMCFVRQRATKYTVTNAETLGYPSLEADPADADWTGEITAASADTTLAFGKRELKPSPLSKLVKVSRPLLAKVPDAEGIVRQRLAYKFAITEEKAFLTGTGANQPLGIFTASSQGISTGQDNAAAATTAIVFDDLIGTMFKLKAAYWKSAEWIMHRTIVSAVRKLKDTAGYYIWQPATMPAVPSTLLERPLNVSEYAPSTMTAGLYVAAYGDLSYYHIADSLNFNIQVLVELYALTNQTAYVARQEVDGLPALEEAFARLIMHA